MYPFWSVGIVVPARMVARIRLRHGRAVPSGLRASCSCGWPRAAVLLFMRHFVKHIDLPLTERMRMCTARIFPYAPMPTSTPAAGHIGQLPRIIASGSG
jgi:hypothetical protein